MRRTVATATAGKRGFALPAVLTVTTALTLVFLTALLSLEGLRDEARNAVALETFHREALSAEARVAFLALTEPFGPRGIQVGGQLYDPVTGAPLPTPASQGDSLDAAVQQQILIDGTPYVYAAGDGSQDALVMELQDEAGLVNLNYANSDAVSAAFQRAGADPLLADTLADQLHDYISASGAPSLNGADSADYQRAGVAPPPGRPLETWAQLYGLLALRGGSAVDMGRLRSFAMVAPVSTINVNTAPSEALMTWFPISEGLAQDIVQSRQKQPITSLSALAVPMPPSEMQQYYFPDGNLRLTFTDPAIPAVYRARFELSPNDPQRPFWILDSQIVQQPTNARVRQDVSQLPRFPDITSPAPGG